MCHFFAGQNQRAYEVTLRVGTSGKAYITDLTDEDSGFNIKHFLIDENSTLTFKSLADNLVGVSLTSGNVSYLVSQKTVNGFAKEVFSFFLRFDGFSAFSPYFERSQAGYIIVRKGENLLVRLLNTNINDTNRGRRWFDEVFIVDSQGTLLCQEWTEKKNNNGVPSLEDFATLVKDIYQNRFSFIKEDGLFILKDEQENQRASSVASSSSSNASHHLSSLQQIFYGAPGTGKSHTINRATSSEDVIRTTFHPDTDYSTFVGAYKPTTVEEEVITVIGTKAVPVENPDGSLRTESKIVYEFVPQAFLQAYVAAWNKYAKAQNDEPRKQFLVIEEINRGNCAQIFGDLFQLLDRNAQGFSDYPITADADMKRQLKKAFEGLALAKADSINAMYNGRNVCREVLNGEILLLPNNLYIWATMNTSDQSLFPIDSAFKRRWDWSYRPISDAKKGWKITADGNLYDWWTFLQKINDKIGSLTNSEDKKLGYFFCKADNEGRISADKFVGKVIFYLWNDVFKDYEFADAIFDDAKGGKLTFDKFYTECDASETEVVEENIALFLKNLGLEPIEVKAQQPTESDSPNADENNEEVEDNGGGVITF